MRKRHVRYCVGVFSVPIRTPNTAVHRAYNQLKHNPLLLRHHRMTRPFQLRAGLSCDAVERGCAMADDAKQLYVPKWRGCEGERAEYALKKNHANENTCAKREYIRHTNYTPKKHTIQCLTECGYMRDGIFRHYKTTPSAFQTPPFITLRINKRKITLRLIGFRCIRGGCCGGSCRCGICFLSFFAFR